MIVDINGIYGQINASGIDLNDKCNVFIGENGIGKSTTLKIIDCICRNDFVSIVKYNFESIRFTFDNGEKKLIKWTDYVTSHNRFLKKFRIALGGIIKVEGPDEEERNPYLRAKSCIYELLQDKEIYDSVIKFLYRDEEIQNEIKFRIMELINNPFCCYDEKAFYNIVIKYLDYWDDWESCEGVKYLQSCEFSKNRLNIENLKNKAFDGFYLNMASTYKINNNLKENKIHNVFESELSKKMYWNDDIPIEYMHLVREQYKYDKFLEKKKDYQLRFALNKYLDEVYKTDCLELGEYLFIQSVNGNVLDKFKTIYYNFISDNKNCKRVSLEDDGWNFGVNEKTKFEFYLKPFLPDDCFLEKLNLEAKRRFLSIFLDQIKPMIDENLKGTNEMLEYYFKNKRVIATPNGLLINMNEQCLTNDLKFEYLSAGEKKIAIIAVMCNFLNGFKLCLDEPENSLSIVWQETLIKYLIEHCPNIKIAVATQASSIVEFIEQDEWNKYVVPLIGKKKLWLIK